jgi:enterochelin esterase family protein
MRRPGATAARIAAVTFTLAVLGALAHPAAAQPREPERDPGPAQAAAGVPATSNVRGSRYPLIHEENRVTFRIKAPEARSVAVRGRGALWDGGTFAMARDEAGVWSVTTPPAPPGFYYYDVVVDGFATTDPGSETFFGWGRQQSGIELPDPGRDFDAVKEVPHGDVRIHTYHARTTGGPRRVFVYTPPGYDRGTRRYPVLYLQHGSGESERAWTAQGRAQFILDNLLAAQKAEPMLVVMEQGYAVAPDQPAAPNARGNEAFEALVVNDLVPAIDRAYRTIPRREARAIAGLSMGGGQALRIGLAHRALFASIAAMSGGAGLLVEGEAPAALLGTPAALNRELRLLWLGCGQQDGAFARTQAARTILDRAGIRHVWFETAGAHEWSVWRASLHDLAPRLFRAPAAPKNGPTSRPTSTEAGGRIRSSAR